MMYTICKRWQHFISESILAVFTFRKYLSSFLLGFPFHGMFWVILYAHEMCGGGWWLISYFDIRRFCLFRYLTFIYYFKFPVIITGPHFSLYVLFCKCGQFWEVVWQLNFKRKSNMVNGIFMTQMICLLKLVCITMHIDGFELCNTF